MRWPKRYRTVYPQPLGHGSAMPIVRRTWWGVAADAVEKVKRLMRRKGDV